MKLFEKEDNNEKISLAIIHLLIEIGTRGIGRFVHVFIFYFFLVSIISWTQYKIQVKEKSLQCREEIL